MIAWDGLPAALQAAGWPRITFGRVAIEGERAWRAVVPTPSERRTILHRLGKRELLLVTDVARRRLREWLDLRRGRPVPVETQDERKRRVGRELHYFGDVELLPVVAGALACAPPPVQDYALSDCLFLTTGRSSGGWTTGMLPNLRPIVIAGHTSDAEVARVALHELAHCWTLDLGSTAPTAFEILSARATTIARGWEADCAEQRQAGEDHADLLAECWLA